LRLFSTLAPRLGVSALIAMACALGLAPAARADAGKSAKSNPSEVLAETLSAACRHDEADFVTHLPAQTAKAFDGLPEKQRSTLLARLALLSGPGKSLLSTANDGHTIVRCEAGGMVTEMHFGAVEAGENLAFVAVDVPAAEDQPAHSVRFGMVREGGDWRLLSVGLLMLDLPSLSQQWVEEDVRASEMKAVDDLRDIAQALQLYQRGFDHLPETLDQLGPAPPGDISPDHASLLKVPLASGQEGDYRFRYVIVPSRDGADQEEKDKAAKFVLAATPLAYGKAGTGRRSFYLDSDGTLHGADKQGEVATSTDPEIDDPRP
jgi:hypothetical protein